LVFAIDKHFKPKTYKPLQKDIVSFWSDITKLKNKVLIKQIKKYKKALNLNDWGVYKLSFMLGDKLYQNKNSATLFSWFILTKLGFDVKTAYDKNNIYLLATTKQKLYQVVFFNLDSKRYYILFPNGRIKNIGSIQTYNGNYPKANEKFSFDIKKPLNFAFKKTTKDIGFQNNIISIEYNQNIIDFYKTYPQADYNIYFSTKNSTPLSNSILLKLAPLVKNKSEIEAVNLLLRFVQTSFKYKTDQKQFDYEKVMFPEETIFYPYSDCEDRRILLAYLVKKLTRLDVVGVKYSDHMAIAVTFNSDTVGAKFRYNGKVYTITDPTYINANVGQVMPKYKNKSFEIVKIHR